MRTAFDKQQEQRSRVNVTRFEPSTLSETRVHRYLKRNGTACNKSLSFDLFDSVVQMREFEDGTIHAVGLNFKVNKPVILILKK